jgi:predicted nucleotidyltransferase
MPKGNKVRLNNPKILEWAREELELEKQVVAQRFNKKLTTLTHGKKAKMHYISTTSRVS